MNKFLVIALSVVLGAVPVHAIPVTKAGTQPYALVRTLQNLQERIALGSRPAHKLQAKLLDHIAEKFARVPPSVWMLPKNARAAIAFVLSGGHPAAVRHLTKQGAFDPEYAVLLQGALAYADGRRDEAVRILGKVDEGALPPSLGGHLALVKSALIRSTDLKKAMLHLNKAQLLMPASLVEESALRRGIVLSGEDGDRERFLRFAQHYLRRFNHSVYLPDFRLNFARLAVSLDVISMPNGRQNLQNLLGQLDSNDRRELYLDIGRLALTKGDRKLALFSASKAKELSVKPSRDYLRAQAYGAAAGILTANRMQAVEDLNVIDRHLLAPADRHIVNAALQLAAELTRLPKPAHARLDAFRVHGEEMGGEAASKVSPVMARAANLFGEVDSLIKEYTQ